MRTVFADSAYYLALLFPRDAHHALAQQFTAEFKGRMVTTAWVLTEVGNAMSSRVNRALFVEFARQLWDDQQVQVVGPNLDLFERAFDLYSRRPDKDWSLTDCISFVVMQDEGLTEAATTDHHFEQAGLTVLLK